MTQSNLVPAEPRSVLTTMSTRYGMEPQAFEATVRATCMSGVQNVSREQFAAFLLVAKEYDLNPITKEIFAFPNKGGIQPIVSIDGWMAMINRQSAFDGMEFRDIIQDGQVIAVTCTIWRKDRTRPTEVTEYMAECRRNTDVWRQWPSRMLRHKAAIQCARYAFGFSGIMEPDEWERAQSVPQPQPTGLRQRLQEARTEAPTSGFLAAHAPAEDVVDLETGEITTAATEPEIEQQAAPAEEASEEAPRLTREVFDSYGKALARFSDEAALKKAAAAFWKDNGGWPPASDLDRALGTAIFAAHTNRAAGKLSPEDTAAHVVDLLDEEFGA